MKKKKSLICEADILIVIAALKKIINIFLGPFLTAYFIKVSADSLADLSLYNVMSYGFLGIGGTIIGSFIKSKYHIGRLFRVGVVTNFIYILAIVILKENIVNNLSLISFLYGISAATYYYPFNLFLSGKVKNGNRTKYELKKQIVSTSVSIITPIALGSIITTTNFELTAIIILIISLIQVVLSFMISPVDSKDYEFTLKDALKQFRKSKDVKNVLKINFFEGMNISDGALGILITILIFNAFKTDLNLGIFSSVSSILAIIFQFIYVHKLKEKHNSLVIILCALIPVVNLITLLFITNDITISLYYVCYNSFLNVLFFILDVKLYNISNSRQVRNSYRLEFWAVREFVLNLGRVISYALVFIFALLFSEEYLNYLMIFLSISILITAYYGLKVDDHEKY